MELISPMFKQKSEAKRMILDHTYHILSVVLTLNKLVFAWSNNNMNNVDFIEKLKAELPSLETQVIEIVKLSSTTNTSPTSLPKL
jgi:hypothetical protein